MLSFLKEIKKSVKKLDNFTTENHSVTNPFAKKTNNTIVWTDKPFVLNKIVKNSKK